MDIDITASGKIVLLEATKEINKLNKVLYNIDKEEARLLSKILLKLRI